MLPPAKVRREQRMRVTKVHVGRSYRSGPSMGWNMGRSASLRAARRACHVKSALVPTARSACMRDLVRN